MKIELTENHIRELNTAARDRAAALDKEATKLIGLGRHSEAKNLASTAQDIRERLCTHLTAALSE